VPARLIIARFSFVWHALSIRSNGREIVTVIRRRLPRRSDKSHLDEVVITIARRKHSPCRAVDQDGFVLDVLVQSRRNTRAAYGVRAADAQHQADRQASVCSASCRIGAAKERIVLRPIPTLAAGGEPSAAAMIGTVGAGAPAVPAVKDGLGRGRGLDRMDGQARLAEQNKDAARHACSCALAAGAGSIRMLLMRVSGRASGRAMR
jgi:DDE domain